MEIPYKRYSFNGWSFYCLWLAIIKKQNYWNKLNDYIKSKGGQELKTQLFINDSPYLNIYPFPRELDYTEKELKMFFS